MAEILTVQEKLPEARAILIPALDVLREQRGMDDLETQHGLQSLAKIYMQRKEFDLAETAGTCSEAEQFLRESLDIRKASLTEDSWGYASASSGSTKRLKSCYCNRSVGIALMLAIFKIPMDWGYHRLASLRTVKN